MSFIENLKKGWLFALISIILNTILFSVLGIGILLVSWYEFVIVLSYSILGFLVPFIVILLGYILLSLILGKVNKILEGKMQSNLSRRIILIIIGVIILIIISFIIARLFPFNF
ncbi:MAG: hypothetical protein NT076_04435 [Candidatus Pacearchaeota archaeon]|nr:hypothetical protein [Candidatus Pacearchaeota archaeon]